MKKKPPGSLSYSPGRRIHEAAGGRWLECFRQLFDLKRTNVGRNRDQLMGAQELDDLGQA